MGWKSYGNWTYSSLLLVSKVEYYSSENLIREVIGQSSNVHGLEGFLLLGIRQF
jgi:hypothetical protein